MKPLIRMPRVSDHGSEIALFALIAVGVIWMLMRVIDKGVTGWDVAACLMVLQQIISAVKERWTQRSVDRMGQNLQQSAPAPSPPEETTIKG